MFNEISDSSVRYDGAIILSVRNGNPNGNPDMGNTPRVASNGNGIISDVSLKRRIRDYVVANYGEQSEDIFVQAGKTLQAKILDACGGTPPSKKKAGKKSDDTVDTEDLTEVTTDTSYAAKGIENLLSTYWDTRMFGAVLSIGALKSFGSMAKIQGPAHVSFAESVKQVIPVDHKITRVVHADEDKSDSGTFGNKQVIENGIFVARVGYSPQLTEKINRSLNKWGNDFSIDKSRADRDLELFWEGLYHLYDIRSASIGDANVLGLVVFKHSSPLGDAQSHRLLERISVDASVGSSLFGPINQVLVNQDDMPENVTVHTFA